MKHIRRNHDDTGSTAAGDTQGAAVPPRGGHERVEHVEHHDDARRDEDVRRDAVREGRTEAAHDRFGGMNIGAAFFGWLVAIGMVAILIGIISAILTAVGSTMQLNPSDARQEAGGIGLAAAITLAVVLFLAYYAGGYVAGRMSRFDGARQGLGVWIVGLVITILVAILAAVAGSQYDILSRVQLPSIPLADSTATWGGIITLAAVVILTAVGAVLGGIAGHRYHNKVDRAAGLR